MKTNVYVDTFNLYYGLLKGSSYCWLDIHKLHPCKAANPAQGTAAGPVSVELKRSSSKSILIREASLAVSQFPNTLQDLQGRTITKPQGW